MTRTAPSLQQSSSAAVNPTTSLWTTVGAATDTRAVSAAFTTDSRKTSAASAPAVKHSPDTSLRWSQSRSRAEHLPTVQQSRGSSDAKRLASIAAPWAGSLSVGSSVGYSLPAARSLVRIRDNTTEYFHISDKEIFWFDSLLLLGAVFGSLCACFVVHWLGRRRMLAVGCLGSLASWLVMAAASADSFHLLAARVLGGLCTGVVSLVVPAYISEAAPAKDRGKTCGAYQTGVAAGVLIMYVLGKFANWSQMALWCAMPPAMALLLLWMTVESPRWLYENAQHEDAHKALRILRGSNLEADAEYEEIEAIYVKTPTPLIHYMLAVLVMLVQQFSGVNAILLFACGPLHAGFGYASHDTFIVLSSLQLVTTAVSAQLLDVVGRLKPLAVSVVVSTGSVIALGGVYFGVSHDEPAFDTHLAARITVVCKVIFTIGFSLGLGPASWALAVELAPLRNNGFEFGSVCAFHWASALAIISMFSIVGTTTASLALLVFLSGAVTFAGGMTALKLLPDTRCVSLEGILLRGQAEGTTRRASDIMDALKPPDALQQMTKTEHEDHKALRGEHKRHQHKEEAHHSAGRLSTTSTSKSKAKAHAKSTAKPPATPEPRAKPEARAKHGAVEAVASRDAEVKSGMLRTETPVVSPVEEAPEKQEMSGSDEEEQP